MIRHQYHSIQHSPVENAAVGSFVSGMIWGDNRGFSPFCSMAVFDGAQIIAGVVYHNMDPDAGVIELSAGAVSPRWLQPSIIRAMFALPFDFLGSQMCVLRVAADNTNMVAIARRFGFAETRVPRLWGRDRDGLVFTMTDDAWRAHRLYKQPASR